MAQDLHRPGTQPAEPENSGGLERRILTHLGPVPLAEDQMIRDLGVSPREMAQALAVLEMSGRVIRSAGGKISAG